MSYVDKILEPGETIRYRTTVSWTIYTPPLLLAVGAAIAAIGALRSSHHATYWWIAAIMLIIASIAAFIPAWLRRWTTEIAVTDRRIIFKRGLIRRHTIEMNMDKVETVDVDQSLAGRLLGYGDIVVRGTGSSIEPFRKIAAPLDFRNQVTAR